MILFLNYISDLTLESYLSLHGMQLKFCSDQLQRLAEDKLQCSVTSENTQRRLSDIRRQTQQIRDTVVELQSKIGSNRVTRMELQVELEKERYLVCHVYDFCQMFFSHFCCNLVSFLLRFAKKRTEEDLEVARRKFSRLKEQNEGSSITEKLQQELEEYREIIKCSICHDRAKEVFFKEICHIYSILCLSVFLFAHLLLTIIMERDKHESIFSINCVLYGIGLKLISSTLWL